MSIELESGNSRNFRRRLFLTLASVTTVIVVMGLLFVASHVVVMFFTAIMLALFLRGIGRLVSRFTPLRDRWAMAAGIVMIVGLFALSIFFFGPRLSSEFDRLAERLPQSVNELESSFTQSEVGQEIINLLPQSTEGGSSPLVGSGIISQFTGVVSTTLGFILDTLIILVIGFYLAFEPSLYRENFVRLFPKNYRERMSDILDETGEVLMNWLIARAASVVVVIILTIIGLTIIRMPLVFTLSVIAGVLSFIPNLGPALGAIPAILIAFVEGPQMVLYVIGLYALVQTIESYFITPNIERYTLSLPPALVLSLQVLAAIILGPLAVFIAAPALAAVIVLVKEIYVEDMLGDEAEDMVRSHQE